MYNSYGFTNHKIKGVIMRVIRFKIYVVLAVMFLLCVGSAAFADTVYLTDDLDVAGYPLCKAGTAGDLGVAGTPSITFTVDVTDTKQTIHNFGASDAWSTQYVGNWPTATKEGIADLLFNDGLDDNNNPIGAALSSWRFNIGAGSDRNAGTNAIDDHWRETETFFNSTYTGYDWTAQSGQRWFLQRAKTLGVDEFYAFVNSPPINLTKSGYAYSTNSTDATNLGTGNEDEFATYLADILEHFRDVEGIDFDYVSPINEPQWSWEGGQEGCRYYNNSDIKAVVDALYDELDIRMVATEIEVIDSGTITDLYGGRDFIDDFWGGSNDISNEVAGSIAGHSYWSEWPNGLVDERASLQSKVASHAGLEYSMSEYCILGDYGGGLDLSIDPALFVGRVIHHDLAIANAVSWQWWLGVSPYDYKDGLVYCDKSDSGVGANYYESKMLWAMGNYSRFVRPGMQRVGVTRDDGASDYDAQEGVMVSSYYQTANDIVVTVVVNWSNSDQDIDLSLSGATIDRYIPYVTSSTGDLAAYNAIDYGETISIPQRSVVTLVGYDSAVGSENCDDSIYNMYSLVGLANEWLSAGVDWDIAPLPSGDSTVDYVDYALMAGDFSYDVSEPTPSASTFYDLPTALSTTEITMAATVAADDSCSIEYLFEETSGNSGGADSGWQKSNVYTNSGLDALTTYNYKVSTRDGLGNTGTASATTPVTTKSSIISATKDVYTTSEDVKIDFFDTDGHWYDFIAIYSVSCEFPTDCLGNYYVYEYTFYSNSIGGASGQLNFGPLPSGVYVAIFYDNGNYLPLGQTTFNVGGLVPQSGWSLHYVDSEETAGEDGAAANAFDGDSDTKWHTEWSAVTTYHPHEIQIDLGGSYTISGFKYLPRQDYENGRIANYQFYVSSNGSTWGTAVATGTFSNDTAEVEVSFTDVVGGYVRLVATSEVNGGAWTSVAEINVVGVGN